MSSKKQIKTINNQTTVNQTKISKSKQPIKKELLDNTNVISTNNDSSSNTDSSSDSDSDTDSSSDNDLGNNNVDNDSDSESDTPKTKPEKLVKQKKEVEKISHNELITQITELRQKKKLRKIKFLEIQKEYEKEETNDDKLLDKLLSQLSKVHNDEKNSTCKTKIKKTPKQNTGGIHKVDVVPHVFLKFLDKEENTLMSFKDILSQFHSKLKELGLKSGQITTLDEKTSKLFNHPDYPTGTVINFSGYGTFIKKICNHYSAKTNVSL